jgi:acetyl-CoA C-acetyltransferase
VIEPGVRRQDCGQITDGACGVVLASAEFAPATRAPPGTQRRKLARITGWGHRNAGLRLKDKITRSANAPYVFPHVRQAMEDAWRRAGVRAWTRWTASRPTTASPPPNTWPSTISG